MKKIRDAQTIIGMLEDGELAHALGSEITETLAKLKELGADRPKSKVKGSVTLKINFEVSANSVQIVCDVDSKRPRPVRGESFYWVMDDGSLSTEHPQQTDMFSGPRAARQAENA
jgi:hypothetical protein